MKRTRRRKCKACGQLYRPDPRAAAHQRYCAEPACQNASHRASQGRWARRPENRDYWRGPEQVARVQAWRKKHPAYWRRERGGGLALQDVIETQPAAPQQDKPLLALQDASLMQPAVLVGLIASLTGQALQDQIATHVRKLHHRGQQILGMVPGMVAVGDAT